MCHKLVQMHSVDHPVFLDMKRKAVDSSIWRYAESAVELWMHTNAFFGLFEML